MNLSIDNMISCTPSPPYYAVIFTSIPGDQNEGYTEMQELIMRILPDQPGYLGVESAAGEMGITVSYWRDLKSIKAWKMQADHQLAQQKGRQHWYAQYKVRICKVERDYSLNPKNNPSF